jgi:hypothetical protein
MEDPKALKFFIEVLSKTRAGRIHWEATAGEDKYIAAVGGQFTLVVSTYTTLNKYGDTIDEGIALLLKDSKDRELISVTREVDGVVAADLRELYEYARRRALDVNAKLDQVLGELGKL